MKSRWPFFLATSVIDEEFDDHQRDMINLTSRIVDKEETIDLHPDALGVRDFYEEVPVL